MFFKKDNTSKSKVKVSVKEKKGRMFAFFCLLFISVFLIFFLSGNDIFSSLQTALVVTLIAITGYVLIRFMINNVKLVAVCGVKFLFFFGIGFTIIYTMENYLGGVFPRYGSVEFLSLWSTNIVEAIVCSVAYAVFALIVIGLLKIFVKSFL